ncbi:MAG: hypothetical protein M3R25_09490 [Bacteroidota bacterium]|nr:hypothetical protein [Bacteroidota bacterium]
MDLYCKNFNFTSNLFLPEEFLHYENGPEVSLQSEESLYYVNGPEVSQQATEYLYYENGPEGTTCL